ncbi:MAG: VOC family protein [Planctomycetes bacterium]|nr:VOC family protein [Planctomycetota bacterium]
MPELTHIALRVADIARTAEFYREWCGMNIVHDRGEGANRVVWLAEPGKEETFVFVLMLSLYSQTQRPTLAHFGFAVESRDAVDDYARRGADAGILAFGVHDFPQPVGYFCGVHDPDGNVIEFSFGQPLKV